MSAYEEKELAIIRAAVDKAENKAGKRLINSDDVQKIILIVEQFIISKKLVCYGGTAINNILPEEDRFYNKEVEMPDYDFFSPNSMTDAKDLADIYYKAGYSEVEAKAGMHHGTYKVFVNFMPIADITYMPQELFKVVKKNSITVNNIMYAPPDYLRMSMYLELSRPKGDVSRWEKVLKRLILLNKNYPMKNPKCKFINFMRGFTGKAADAESIYDIVKNSIIDQELVFFGGYANELYSKYMPQHNKKKIQNNPDFDALSTMPEKSALIIKDKLIAAGHINTHINKRKGVGEIIAPHYEIVVDKDTVAFIYEPLACHSFNEITINKKKIKVATIDTMLSFYLAFLYADRPYYDHDRIYCMSQLLYYVQAKNRLQQKGVLKRFGLQCTGNQTTLEDMRNTKTMMFNKLKHDRSSDEYEEWFLKYSPKGDTSSGSRAPISGSRAPISGSRAPISGSRTPISGSRTPISGSRTPISGRRGSLSSSSSGRGSSSSLTSRTSSTGKYNKHILPRSSKISTPKQKTYTKTQSVSNKKRTIRKKKRTKTTASPLFDFKW